MLPGNVQPRHLANALGFETSELFEVSHRLKEWFRPSFQAEIGGKLREFDPPTDVGKRRLQRLARFIADELPLHPCAHGSVRRRSAFTAARRHLGERNIVTFDVADCFPSTNPDRFERELIELGFAHDVAILLTRILLYRGRLPQGSPASNAALNLFLFRTDEHIRTESAKFSGRYTRYCDDLVISVPRRQDVVFAQDLMCNAIESLGFQVNAKKRIESGLQLVGMGERLVNGVVTNSDRYTRLPTADTDRIVLQCVHFSEGARSVCRRSILGLAQRRRRLHGLISYISQSDNSPLAEMRRLLHLGDSLILDRLRSNGLAAHANCWWLKNQFLDEPLRLAKSWPRGVLVTV
ncbi:MAG: RNA-directed polymerase [Phycisphaerales bacterium]|nr:RNA-directed polymerase [Phycisphaerales bacterium]